jgi:hypothetical protein
MTHDPYRYQSQPAKYDGTRKNLVSGYHSANNGTDILKQSLGEVEFACLFVVNVRLFLVR